jgi:hypothetical protein
MVNAPTAKVVSVKAAAPVAAATAVPTPTPVPTQIPQAGDVPVVFITPIATLQIPSPYNYPQPSPYYPQPYYYPYYPYPNTYAPCNRATFIADVTVADGTNFAQGAKFTKTWRLRNDGTCTWTTGYSLIFDHGSAMGGSTVSLPNAVAPGGVIDLSVDQVAPSSDGTYQGFWMLQDANANRFGIGYNAAIAFWVKITVGAIPYSYPYPYPYPYPNPYPYPSPYHPPVVTGSCALVAVSPATGTTYSPNGDFDIKWTIKNTGSSTWSKEAVDYQYVGGTKLYKRSSIYDLPSDVASGSQVDIVLDALAPASTGRYYMTWALVQSNTTLCTMSVTINVK